MFGNNNGISLADIAAVTRGTNNDGLGSGAGGWWVLIILLALFGGFNGRNGMFGGNCGGNGFAGGAATYIPYPINTTSGGVAPNYILGTDFAIVERKLDGIVNGLSSIGYDSLSQTNNIRSDIAAGFSGVNNAVCTLGYQNAQLVNGLQAQLSDCCCQNREAIAQVRYDMATDTCAITNAMNQGFQNVMQNCNANYRQLHDEMIASRMEAKDDTIAMLRAELTARDNQAVNAAQTAQLTTVVNDAFNRTHPCAIPAYTVPNPYVSTNYCCQQGGCCR